MQIKKPSHNFAVAVCAFEIAQTGSELQLLPAGKFRAVDGRPLDAPHWFIDAAIASRVIQKVNARKNKLVIDYEHQTLLSKQNGEPAPAAGWFKNIEWREGQGLFITDAEFTGRATAYLTGGEYRYVSAVFPYNKKTGEVLDIYMAALTNNPGVDGMDDVQVAAASFNFNVTEDTTMDPILLALLTALGLGEDATEEQAVAALTALQEKANDTDNSVAALTAQLDAKNKTAFDPTKHAPIKLVTELQTQVAALSKDMSTDKVTSMIAVAKKQGKPISESTEAYLRSLAAADLAACTAFIDNIPAIAALTGNQTDGKSLGQNNGELSEEQLALCTRMGIDPEDYKKNLA